MPFYFYVRKQVLPKRRFSSKTPLNRGFLSIPILPLSQTSANLSVKMQSVEVKDNSKLVRHFIKK